MKKINTYLHFDGNCKVAFEFYKSVFGGEFSDFNTYKDLPKGDSKFQVPKDKEDKIMHVSLAVGENTLMGADAIGVDFKSGNNFSVSINTDSLQESKDLFALLSKGGKVVMPLEKTFWGAHFGMLVDKFGISWMLNCQD